jgi:hypothetical protein
VRGNLAELVEADPGSQVLGNDAGATCEFFSKQYHRTGISASELDRAPFIHLFRQATQEDTVKALIPISLLALILAGLLVALSCGAGNSQSQLTSVAVNPPGADAQNYPSGEVPFVATGYYSNPMHTVTPLTTATWTACNNGNPTTDIILSQSGTAQCASGAKGTYSINATAITTSKACPAITPCGALVGGCTVTGIAQLTCP